MNMVITFCITSVISPSGAIVIVTRRQSPLQCTLKHWDRHDSKLRWQQVILVSGSMHELPFPRC